MWRDFFYPEATRPPPFRISKRLLSEAAPQHISSSVNFTGVVPAWCKTS
jgi:hypothetical protein